MEGKRKQKHKEESKAEPTVNIESLKKKAIVRTYGIDNVTCFMNEYYRW